MTTTARVERVLQQSVEPALGEYKAMRVCVPACFFMVAKAQGYLQHGPGSDLISFANSMQWDTDFTQTQGWLRPKLASTLRKKYGLGIVSWQVNGNHDDSNGTIARMRAAGYLHTDREVGFYRQHVVGRSIEDLARAGYILIVGVLPHFGAADSTHSIVITRWDNNGVEVIDPDERNPQHVYTAAYVRKFINPNGGGATLILPRE